MKCGQGTAGLLIISSSGPVTLRNSTFLLISSNAEEGSAVSISASHSIIMEQLMISHNKNQGCGAVFVSGFATASLRLSRSIQEMNNGGAFCLSNLAQIFIETSEFRYNNASAGGAIQLRASASAATSFSIEKSLFEGNQADIQGGALYIFFSAPAVLLRLAIQDSVFDNNRGKTGAVLFLSPQIQLQAPSYLTNVKIANSHSDQGALALTHQNGTLALSSMTFEGNIGDSESCLYVLFSYSSGGHQNTLSIANSVFSNNTGRAIIRFPYSITGIHFLLDNVTFQNNTGIGLDLSNVLLDYTNSVTLQNTEPAVMLARLSKAVLRKMKFQDNQATVVQLVDQSALYCDFCEFTETSNGGALQAESSSMVTLLNSVFRNNQDSDGSAIKLLMASASSLFNCSFVGNHATVKGSIMLMSTSLLLINCLFSRNTAGKAAGLIAIESQVSFIGCQLENQSGTTGYFLFITSLSFVSLTNTRLAQGESQEEGAIYVEESSITLANCELTGITGRKGALIYAFGNANVTFQNTYVSTFVALDGLVYLWLSAGHFQNSTFSNYQGSAVTAQESSLLFSNCYFNQGQAEEGVSLRCLNCLSSTLFDSEFAQLKAGRGGAVYIARGELAIRECRFAYNEASEGGAIYAQDVSLSISESVFTNNSAIRSVTAYLSTESPGRGGAVVFGNSNSNYTLSILHSQFLYNEAEVKGGAIAWTGSLPTLQTLTFIDNFAPYGFNVSSFPIAILASSSYLSQSVSGQPYLSPLVFSLIDHYNQTVISDNSTKAGLTIYSANATVYGGPEVTASLGVLTFSDFSIAATPGTNVSISAAVPDLISLQNLTIYVRPCEPGESQVDEKCLLCKAPKYSFNPADLCKDCLSEAVCTGGAKVYPKAGYWRYDWLSTTFLQCPNTAACLGPADEISTCEGNSSCSSQLSPKGTCMEGYKGNMCQTCSINYHRVSKIWCKPCPSYSSSVALSIGYALAVTSFSIFIVVTSIKSARKHKSLHSVYLKVLMNYLQLVMLMGSFNLSWPTMTKELLNVQDSAGSFSEHLFSTDCLESDFDENEAFYTKLVLLSATPIIFFTISSLCWLLIAAIKRSVSVLKNELIASGIILFFLLHPSVMRVMFGAFNCEEIQPGEYWVSSLLVRCWEGKHLTYALGVALPAIIIWGLGLPAIILGNLIMHRKKLKDNSVRMRYGFMIKGYSESRYFWEFIIIYRKLLIITIATFLSRIAKMTQALFALSVLVFSLALQHRNKPYSHPSLNTMEYRSILVSIATIFFGLYYLDRSLSESWQFFFFAVTLGVNLYFLQFWFRNIFATCVVMAVHKISWLRSHFVVINEISVVSNKTFLKRFKSSIGASRRAMARALPALGKEIYLRKLMQQ
jgi:predicted outer membrane repeat protein